MDESSTCDIELPGFRFHPTEEELVDFYLKNMSLGKKLHYDIIGVLNIYHHDPWDLPGLAKIGEREWYFFVTRDRKHGSGGRPNRTTKNGFWKATGSDRKVLSLSHPKKKMIGLKKTLVFYTGRAPRGCKTDWVMNEYRLPDDTTDACSGSNEVVLCKIYRKATSLRVLEQRAAIEQEQIKAFHDAYSGGGSLSPPMDAASICNAQHDHMSPAIPGNNLALKKEDEELSGLDKKKNSDEDDEQDSLRCKENKSKTTIMGKASLAQLQLPKQNMDWTQDPLWTQLRSPWLDNLTPSYYYANLLNF